MTCVRWGQRMQAETSACKRGWKRACVVYAQSAKRSASVPHSSMPSGKSAFCPALARSTSFASRFPAASVACKPGPGQGCQGGEEQGQKGSERSVHELGSVWGLQASERSVRMSMGMRCRLARPCASMMLASACIPSSVMPSMTCSGSMTLPSDLDILRPCASRTMACRYT